MNVVTEFVKFDDEDRGNIDYEGGECPYGIHRAEKDHMFFLCYYTPEKQNGSLISGTKKAYLHAFCFINAVLLQRVCHVTDVGHLRHMNSVRLAKSNSSLLCHQS